MSDMVINKTNSSVAESLPCAVFEFAVDEKLTVLSANDVFFTLTEIPQRDFEAVGNSLRLMIYPSDLRKLILLKDYHGNNPQPLQVRIFRPNHTTKWFQLSLKKAGSIGKIPTFLCCMFEIDVQKRAESALKQERNRLQTILRITNNVVLEYNFQTDILTTNLSGNKLFKSESVSEHYLSKFAENTNIHPDDHENVYQFFKQSLFPGMVKQLDYRVLTIDDTYHWVRLTATSVFDSDGEPWLVIGTIRDINDEHNKQEVLTEKSRLDLMTGILNKKTTEDEISARLAEKPEGVKCALLMFDFDDFKLINDKFGHIAGDAILRSFSEKVSAIVGNDDIFGRVGGDEFQIYISEVLDDKFVEEKADMICAKAREICRTELGSDSAVSMGVAFAVEKISYTELYRRADIALYSAKSTGKDHYEIYGRKCHRTESSDASSFATVQIKKYIISDIVDVLFEISNGSDGISKALEFIGNGFALDEVSVFINDGNGKMRRRWSWLPNGVERSSARSMYDLSDFPAPIFGNGVYYVSDTALASEEYRAIFSELGITSYLQSQFTSEGEVVGIINFIEKDGARLWTQTELDVIVLTSKLFTELLLRNHAIGYAEKTISDMQTILNSLSDTGIYVVDRKNFKVLFHNKFMSTFSGEDFIGKLCHKALLDCDSPCANCPIDQLCDGERFTMAFDIKSKTYDVTFIPMLWEHNTSAVLMVAHEHISTDDEFVKKLGFIIRDSVDYLLEVNVETRRYNLYYFADGDFQMFRDRGDFDTMNKIQADKYLAEPYHDTYLKVFSFDNMMSRFNAGEPSIQLEYQRITDGIPSWKRRTATLSVSKSGEKSIIVYARDIDTLVQEKLVRDSQEQIYRLTITKNYQRIYNFDLKTRKIACVFNGGEGHLPTSPRIIEYKELTDFLKTITLETDLETVLEGFSDETMRSRFRQGISEYAFDYRRKFSSTSKYCWIQAQVNIFGDKNGEPAHSVVMLKEISSEKQAEFERTSFTKKYMNVLENNYFNVIEMDLNDGSYTNIFTKREKFIDRDHLREGVIAQGPDNLYFIHPDDAEMVRIGFKYYVVREKLELNGEYMLEYRRLGNDGKFYWVEATFCASENPSKAIVMMKDISDKKAREEFESVAKIEAMKKAESEHYRQILDRADTMVFEYNEGTGENYISPKFSAIFSGRFEGRNVMSVFVEDEIVHPDDKRVLLDIMDDARRGVTHTEAIVRLLSKRGDFIWCRISVDIIADAFGKKRIIGILNNIDSEMRPTLDAKSEVRFDPLTMVATAETFYMNVERLLAENPEKQYKIIRMDINKFKLINDIYGINAGDNLLKYIGAMLRRKLGQKAVYCRLTGDIFCMCVSMPNDKIRKLVEEMGAEISNYPLNNKAIASFGVYIIEDRTLPVNVMCDRANLALMTIKGSYFSHCAFYDQTLREKMLSESQIESVMHESLKNGDFVVYLQPKFRMPDNVLYGAEALVRWNKGTEVLTPDYFIPLFERNGFIRLLDHYVWEQACKIIRGWLDKGIKPIPISVNVSRIHAFDGDFGSSLTDLIKTYGIDASLLQLEITESAFLENDEVLYRQVQRLRNAGFLFAMDDFGSGYSSLNMLKEVPIDIIKLDRGFISEHDTSANGRIVLESTIDMINKLKLEVIAEGVETQKQADFLYECGCRCAQGYLYSRPISTQKFTEQYMLNK